MTLMDIAVIGAKKLKADGILTDLDESEEINACTVKVKVDVNGQDEDWLLLFKNETHNHPTEIEPFGGAATCLGGAIRDPLSGRSYVYQAMRVTGAADPTVPLSDTLPGKLPQKKIVTTAAHGYSSYGNQIGLATGEVTEVYHPNYVAKRMEIGAVIGAAPAETSSARFQTPATWSSSSAAGPAATAAAAPPAPPSPTPPSPSKPAGREVQKGNPPDRTGAGPPLPRAGSDKTHPPLQRLRRRRRLASRSASWRTAWRSTSTRSRRSTTAWTALNWQSPNPRSGWQLSSPRKTPGGSLNWPTPKTSRRPSSPPLPKRSGCGWNGAAIRSSTSPATS